MRVEIIERDLIPGKIYIFNGTAVWKFIGLQNGQITLFDPETNREFTYMTNPTRIWEYEPTFKFGR